MTTLTLAIGIPVQSCASQDDNPFLSPEMFRVCETRTPLGVCALTITANGPIQARTGREELRVLDPTRWPTTIDAAVKDILSKMSNEHKALVRNTKRADLVVLHHGWGTGIRNYYGLWPANSSLIISACGTLCHPDDASMKIVEAVWQSLQK